jgi:succinate dehydrogenase / fumarate reductase cytochrome b subunit
MHPEILRKLHSFTGLLPLGAYLLFHAYEQLAVRAGRSAAILRLDRTTYAPLEVACVLVPLLLHATLGLRLAQLSARGVGPRAQAVVERGFAREPSEDAYFPYASRSFLRMQLWSGIVSAAFLLWHVACVWLPRVVAARPAAGYGAMVDQVATLPRAALYVIGTAAVCVHFGQGLSAVVLRYQMLNITPRAARVLFGLVGLLLWLTFVDELSAYVAGRPLL